MYVCVHTSFYVHCLHPSTHPPTHLPGNNEGAMLLYESQGYNYTTNPFDLLGRALKIGKITMIKTLE